MAKIISKKVLLLTLVAVLLFIVGCNNNNSGVNTTPNGNNDSDQTDEVVKVQVFKSHIGTSPLPESDNPHVQYVAEQTGVEYELLSPPPGAEASEYINLLIASEEYPDIMRPIGGVEQTLLQQGGLLALDDLLPKYAPFVWKSIPKEAWDIVRSASPDGKIYYIPKVYLVPERAPMIRQDWLDAVGLELPTTVEAYKEMLIAFRDKDPNGNGKPDEIPTTGRELGKWMDHLFAIYGVAMWEGVPEWDMYDGKIQYAGVSANMKAAISFIKELYEEKLLDNEVFLNKGDVWQAKINNNLVGNWYHLPTGLSSRYANMLQAAPDTYIVGMPLPKAEGFEGFVTQKSMGEPEWVIPTASEDKAPHALKLLDFMYDTANNEFLTYGIEGFQHNVVDGKKVILPPTENIAAGLTMRNFMNPELMEERIQQTFPEEQQQMVRDIFTVSTSDARRIAGDGLPNTVYEGFPDIQSHKLFQEYLTKIVIGEWSIDKFDEFIDKWNKAGGDSVTKRVQEWYDKTKQ